ncbi:hypothetical protein APHAL10511_000778 [Amanita phalloides]|nr:hypothetical protein APHAL10511_000778 [Amanita phalloides]
MRESNFTFPAQNKACVCINSQLYDRRALDTTAPLPLTNSLQHLQYLTSTSPRIREIMTMDGGLERLISILWDFCLSPPPPENPTVVYGLTPSGYRPPKSAPSLNPTNFDKHAAYRFSLAFKCIGNIGVRGSEPIRIRVVQAGALDVVGCVLEAWLASKGFAIGPSSSATGISRETREQRQARRLAHAEQRQREEAAALARALQRQVQFEQLQQRLQNEQLRLQRLRNTQGINGDGTFVDEILDLLPNRIRARATLAITDGRQAPGNTNSDNEQASDAVTAIGPARDRSGTIVARSAWDETSSSPTQNTPQQHTHLHPQVLLSHPQPQTSASTTSLISDTQYRRNTPSPSASTDTSRAETETEDEPEHDADGDIDMDRVSRSRLANRSTGTVTSRRAEPRLHINATLHDGQRHQPLQNLAVHSHNPVLSPGSAASTPASGSASPSPERPALAGMRNTARQPRFGTMADRAATLAGVGITVGGGTDAHIIISDAVGGGVVGENMNMAMGVGGVGVAGVEDGMESLQANEDFAMGAPPGAPGAIVLDAASVGIDESVEGTTPRGFLDDDDRRAILLDSNSTPRAGVVALPDAGRQDVVGLHREPTIRARRASSGEGSSSSVSAAVSTSRGGGMAAFDAESVASGSVNGMAVDHDIQAAQRPLSAPEMAAAASTASTTSNTSATAASGSSIAGSPAPPPPGPYNDEDVLYGLQLLAYLSKYPHVRQAFYKSRTSFHPANLGLHQTSNVRPVEGNALSLREKEKQRETGSASGTGTAANGHQGFFKTWAGRGRAALSSAGLGVVTGGSNVSASGSSIAAVAAAAAVPTLQMRHTNVFSLVERFTFKPSSNEADLPNPPPKLPAEIQYWAGVIMRNACRKDDSRGGIRQCANMLCGRWEKYPREFAKCRRCRKAKYCGKECQSTAWSEGHRFWCSARDVDEDGGDRERDRERGDTDQTQTRAQVPNQRHHMQTMDEAGEVPNIITTTAQLAVNADIAGQLSPRAERAARRDRERDRRMREPGTDVVAFQQGPPGFAIDLRPGRAIVLPVPTQAQAQQTAVVGPSVEAQRAMPVAGPSHATGAMLTEAATQQHQRLHDYHRIVDSDWLYIGPAQAQAGPSRAPWHTITDMSADEEGDMVLG